jgi:hypothetical protein
VFEPAGDLALEEEPRPAVGPAGVVGLHLLEGDLALQLLVVGDEDLAEPAAGV